MATILTVVFVGGIFLAVGVLFSRRLETENFEIDADGIKFCHISDLHFPECGVSLDRLIEEVAKTEPDIIVATGDIADGSAKSSDIRALGKFLLALSAIAPCYGVIGNHEIGAPYYEEYLQVCKENGMKLLTDDYVIFDSKGRKAVIIGLSDGRLLSEKNLPTEKIKTLPYKKILLAHRPELFENYAAEGADYVFAGHAHGGQFRFLRCGLYAPNQGFFPKYTSGKYEAENCVMFVSRGLGGKGARFFDPFHIITAKI